MRGLNRDRLLRRSAIVAAALAAVVALGLIAGFDGGLLFPIAIGVATSVAIATDTKRTCSPRVLRRRD
jgi:hypothetical protein